MIPMTTENLVEGTLKQYGTIAGVKVKTDDGDKFYIPIEETDFVELKQGGEIICAGLFAEKKEEFIKSGLGLYVHVIRSRPTIIPTVAREKKDHQARREAAALALN
jgi:hypothetical protein